MRKGSLIVVELAGIAALILGAIFFSPWSWRTFLWSAGLFGFAVTIFTLTFNHAYLHWNSIKPFASAVTVFAIGISMVVMVSVPALGVLVTVNAVFDSSPKLRSTLKVRDKVARVVGIRQAGTVSSIGRISAGNQPFVGYYIVVDTLPPLKGTFDLRANNLTYLRVDESSTVLVVEHKKGFLGSPWVLSKSWVWGKHRTEGQAG